uniref:Uncharacterized protein n=1 Tax=Knipowitschia caucasica TaxID=637954 RepID=A0AAV2MPF5_KNICA
MATPDPPVSPVSEQQRPPLAAKALSEAFCGLRYRDTSFLIWRQQQLQATPPHSYLSRSQQTWYSSHGNQPVLVPEREQRSQAESRICSVQ